MNRHLKKLSYLNLFLFLVASYANANNLQDRLNSLDVDLMIRASEDPHFDSYLREQQVELEKQKEIAIQAQTQKRVQLSERKNLEKEYAEEARLRRAKEEAQQKHWEQGYWDKQREENQLLKKQERQYAWEQRVYRHNQQALQQKWIARMQDRISRSPASLIPDQRPRVKKSDRYKLYERVRKKDK